VLRLRICKYLIARGVVSVPPGLVNPISPCLDHTKLADGCQLCTDNTVQKRFGLCRLSAHALCFELETRKIVDATSLVFDLSLHTIWRLGARAESVGYDGIRIRANVES
jgi:hypothetical protein